MPVVTINLIEGYDDSAKARLGRALTDAVRLIIPAPPDAVTVMMREMRPSSYMRGGQPRIPAPALGCPQEVVRGYLAAMEARDLTVAGGFLAAGFQMTFPGGVRMSRLEELVEWAATRYRAVAKTYNGFDTAPGGDHAVVFCHGTLSGTWLDGTEFEGIRFIDRFEVEGGLIRRQDVWNDLAETRSAP
ncbi:MAG: tautomerase family protein [Pseudomonadota bacterium]